MGGFSCKDFSRANPNRTKLQGVVKELTSPGKSAVTMNGILSLLDGLLEPDWVLLENVDAMEDNDPTDCSPLDTLLHRLSEKGYDTQAYRLNAANYGLPQSGIRLFLLALRRPARRLKISDYDGFFQAITTMHIKCEMTSPNLNEVLRRRITRGSSRSCRAAMSGRW